MGIFLHTHVNFNLFMRFATNNKYMYIKAHPNEGGCHGDFVRRGTFQFCIKGGENSLAYAWFSSKYLVHFSGLSQHSIKSDAISKDRILFGFAECTLHALLK